MCLLVYDYGSSCTIFLYVVTLPRIFGLALISKMLRKFLHTHPVLRFYMFHDNEEPPISYLIYVS